MSLFSNILDKLGLGHARAAAPPPGAQASQTAGSQRSGSPPAASQGTAQGSQRPSQPSSSPMGNPPPSVAGTAAAKPGSEVDVTAQLEARAAKNPQKLNWRTSIVDLLKLLDMDSSLEARKSLATELGCPSELMQDSAKMNMWLHKAVIRQLAEHGGKVPPELLH